MNEFSHLPKEPGIYLLTHQITRDQYVGSSQCIRTRVRSHLSLLRTGKHENDKMSNLVRDWGAHFDSEVLELTDDKPRFPIERDWAVRLKSSLNNGLPPKEDRRNCTPTEVINVRMNGAIYRRMVAFSQRHPLRPRLSKIADLALGEFLERHKDDVLAAR